MHTHRRMPARKTEGTRYNLHPLTRLVEAQRLRVDDVIAPEPGCPAVIVSIRRTRTEVLCRVRYIWQRPHETSWPLERLAHATRIHVAVPGEYPNPTR